MTTYFTPSFPSIFLQGLQRDRHDGTAWYNLTCALAQSIPGTNKQTTKSSEQENLAGESVESLREAFRNGFAEISTVRTDPVFDSIRNRDDFKKVLNEQAEILKG